MSVSSLLTFFLLVAQSVVNGFSVVPMPGKLQQQVHCRSSFRPLASSWEGGSNSDYSATGGGAGKLEQIEFKIHPDGRVEETVRGVKGNNCHKITEDINEQLGQVVASAPTEEMYEQVIVQDQTLYNSESSSGGWDGSSSW